MKRKNFEYAGKVLGEVWSQISIDEHPVVAKYIENENEENLRSVSPQWTEKHVRESQYMLQIAKCTDLACCSAPRSSYFNVINDRFLPGPLPLKQTKHDGLRVKRPIRRCLFVALLSHHFFRNQRKHIYVCHMTLLVLRFTNCCPNVCNKCHIYHASVKSLVNHKKVCTPMPANVENTIRPVRIAAKRQRALVDKSR